MTFRLAKQILSGIAVVAVATTAVATDANAAGGSFIVASKVVSDTVAVPSAQVGDLVSTTVGGGCANGDCGNSVTVDGGSYGGCESCGNGDCADGSCGNGTCGDGSCGDGSCGDGACGEGGCGGKGHGGLISKIFGDCGSVGDIGCQPRKYDQPDLFYNYYSQGNCNNVNAQMYISPVPVPHFVGHTFNTYQPLYPHEFMYWHKNRYHNTYDNGRGAEPYQSGLLRTTDQDCDQQPVLEQAAFASLRRREPTTSQTFSRHNIMRKLLLLIACVSALSACTQGEARAGDPHAMTQVWAHNFAMDRPWHGGYYNQNYGQPLAVVVPPTAHMQQSYSWGVSQNLMYPIHHQFGRNASGPGNGGGAPGMFRPTPPWPSHTDQFGYYYIRAPW